MLIEVFKENHLECHCTVDAINEIRAYLNNKIVADNMKLSYIEGTGDFISVTLPSSKK